MYYRSLALLFLLASLIAIPCRNQLLAQEDASKKAQGSDLQKSLLGAWAITGAPGNADEPVADAEMKFWGLGHFAVTKRNGDTGEIDYHHMGTYTLDGDQYAETVTFAIGATENLVGETFKFRIEIEGDTYIQHGIGNPYTQQWTRLLSGKAEAGKDKAGNAEDKKDQQFAVPADATSAELIKFMDRVRAIRPPVREASAVRMHAGKVFGAIVEAADIVIRRNESEEAVVDAISKKMSALMTLSNYDPQTAALLQKAIEEYSRDERLSVAGLAVGYQLRSKSSGLRTATEEEARTISDEVVSYAERFGINKNTYPAIIGVASTLSYSEHKEAAAELHDKLAPYFRDADDESLHRYEARMLGTARRLRLLGHEMDLSGTTADGSEFKWADYRGKVVLVDFWASWCGPCLSEIPNMKKNIEKYSDKGFAIVGINMDSTRAAFEKCVDEHEISWVNILSEEKGKTGWDAPLAVHFGVNGIPTAILVDQSGKVVSLQARGAELDRQLESLLAEAKDESKKKIQEETETKKE